MSTTPTPRTDAAEYTTGDSGDHTPLAMECRTLERKLAEASRQRDEWRAIAERLALADFERMKTKTTTSTPTPRTDEKSKVIGTAFYGSSGVECVTADFARELERELAEAQETIRELRAIAAEAQEVLEGLPMGAVGEDGATWTQINETEETGAPIFGDACYHAGQKAWLVLERAKGSP